MKYLLTFSFIIFTTILTAQKSVKNEANIAQLDWLKTEVFNDSITDKNSLLIKIATDFQDVTLDEFIIFVNGDSINQAQNKQFTNQLFSAEIPLRIDINDIYVVCRTVNTSVLRVIYKPKRYHLSVLAAGIAAEPFFMENASNFSNLLDKQFLLYQHRRYFILDKGKVNRKKINQGYKSLKRKYLGTSLTNKDDVIVSYINGFGLIQEGVLRVKDVQFKANKIEKTSFTISKLTEKISELNCNKVLFLDILLDDNYNEKELVSIRKTLLATAKNQGFSVFALIQNQSDETTNYKTNTLFTDYLLKGMSEKADANKDKIISTVELENYLKKQQLNGLLISVQNEFPLVTTE